MHMGLGVSEGAFGLVGFVLVDKRRMRGICQLKARVSWVCHGVAIVTERSSVLSCGWSLSSQR